MAPNCGVNVASEDGVSEHFTGAPAPCSAGGNAVWERAAARNIPQDTGAPALSQGEAGAGSHRGAFTGPPSEFSLSQSSPFLEHHRLHPALPESAPHPGRGGDTSVTSQRCPVPSAFPRAALPPSPGPHSLGAAHRARGDLQGFEQQSKGEHKTGPKCKPRG